MQLATKLFTQALAAGNKQILELTDNYWHKEHCQSKNDKTLSMSLV
tara:strand:+ start:249 stop:386 length:138 start_codon:yes stop_codon:yes gene_type:complete